MGKERFFVIIHDQHGGACPMTCDDYGNELSLFDTREEAEAAGDRNLMARACGYEIHRLEGPCG